MAFRHLPAAAAAICLGLPQAPVHAHVTLGARPAPKLGWTPMLRTPPLPDFVPDGHGAAGSATHIGNAAPIRLARSAAR
jgi:predicted component of type VI protein secretion system